MGKAPAFQMYAGDFLVDTQGWTATEVGIYTRLLMNEWVNGRLPEEMERLARIGGIDLGNFLKCWRRVIQDKFEYSNGAPPPGGTLPNSGSPPPIGDIVKFTSPGFVNNRLELEREKQDKFRELQSEKGKMGGRPLKSRSFMGALTEQKPEESSSSSSSSSIQKKIYKRKVLSDKEWIEEIKKLHSWINWDDLNREMDTWLLNNPKRQKTRKFITNWILNKQKDKPMKLTESPKEKKEPPKIECKFCGVVHLVKEEHKCE